MSGEQLVKRKSKRLKKKSKVTQATVTHEQSSVRSQSRDKDEGCGERSGIARVSTRTLVFDGHHSVDIIDRGDYIEIRTDGGCTSVYFGSFQLDGDAVVQPNYSSHLRHPIVKKAGAKIDEPLGEEDIIVERIELSFLKNKDTEHPQSSAILRITAIEPCCGSPRYKIVYICDDSNVCSFGMVRRITPKSGEEIVVSRHRGMFPFVSDCSVRDVHGGISSDGESNESE